VLVVVIAVVTVAFFGSLFLLLRLYVLSTSSCFLLTVGLIIMIIPLHWA